MDVDTTLLNYLTDPNVALRNHYFNQNIAPKIPKVFHIMWITNPFDPQEINNTDTLWPEMNITL